MLRGDLSGYGVRVSVFLDRQYGPLRYWPFGVEDMEQCIDRPFDQRMLYKHAKHCNRRECLRGNYGSRLLSFAACAWSYYGSKPHTLGCSSGCFLTGTEQAHTADANRKAAGPRAGQERCNGRGRMNGVHSGNTGLASHTAGVPARAHMEGCMSGDGRQLGTGSAPATRCGEGA